MSNNFFDLLSVDLGTHTVERPFVAFSQEPGDIQRGTEEVLEVHFEAGIHAKHSVLIWAVIERLYAMNDKIHTISVSHEMKGTGFVNYDFTCKYLNRTGEHKSASLEVACDDSSFSAWTRGGYDSSKKINLFNGDLVAPAFHWIDGRMVQYDLLARLLDFFGGVPDVYSWSRNVPRRDMPRGVAALVSTTSDKVALPTVFSEDIFNILSIEMVGDEVFLVREDCEVAYQLGHTFAWKPIGMSPDEYKHFYRTAPGLAKVMCSYRSYKDKDGTRTGVLVLDPSLSAEVVQEIYIEKWKAARAARGVTSP